MPTGPKGQKRPADAVARAVKVAKIATGEIEEDKPEDESKGKDEAAVSMGKRGGTARAVKLTEAERKKIAKKAAKARWAKQTADHNEEDHEV